MILALAKLAGEITERLGHGEMVGELLVGIALGGSVLSFYSPTQELAVLANIGVFMLVMVAGLELSMSDFRVALRGRRLALPLGCFFVPFALGVLLGEALGLGFVVSLVLAVCISITALPVTVRILMDLNLLTTEFGKTVVGAAVFDDLLGIAAFGVVLSTAGAGLASPDPGVIGFLVLKVALFVAVVWSADRAVYYANRIDPNFLPSRVRKVLGALRTREALFSMAVIGVLAFAAFAELVGLHFVLGAFFGAVLLCKEVVGEREFQSVVRSVSPMALGLFAPVFFVYIGLQFDLRALAVPALVLPVLVIAMASKLLGGYLGARVASFPRRVSLAIGAGLNGRGIMELIIAAIALERGIIGAELFSVLVFMGIVTTVLTPFLVRRLAGLHAVAKAGGAEPGGPVEGAARPTGLDAMH